MKKNIVFAFIATLILFGPALTQASSNTRTVRQAAAQQALNKKNAQPKKAKKAQKAKPKVKGSKPAGTPRVAKTSGRSKVTTAKRTAQGKSKTAAQPKQSVKTRSAKKPSKPAPKPKPTAKRAPASRTTQPKRAANPRTPSKPAQKQRIQPAKPSRTAQIRPAAARNVPRNATIKPQRPARISAPAVAAMQALPARTFTPATPIIPVAQRQPQRPVAIPSQGTQGSRLLSDQLIKAVRTGNTNDVTRLLQTPGVNVNFHAPADPRVTRLYAGGNTPLHEALKKVREQGTNNYRAIADALIANPQVDVSAQNDSQATPLLMLAGFIPESNPNIPLAPKVGIIKNNEEVSRPDLAELARSLIQRGADVNAQDMNGRTALHWAVNNGYSELIQLLIQQGANVNTQDIHGRTPLMKAAQKGYLQIMRQLLNANADPNIQDLNKGRTALHWIQRMREGAVIKRGNQMTKERALDAIRLLLLSGANPNITDKVTEDNKTARSSLYWAQQKSPWPVNDNREFNLLMQHSGQRANNANQANSLTQPAYGF